MNGVEEAALVNMAPMEEITQKINITCNEQSMHWTVAFYGFSVIYNGPRTSKHKFMVAHIIESW